MSEKHPPVKYEGEKEFYLLSNLELEIAHEVPVAHHYYTNVAH